MLPGTLTIHTAVLVRPASTTDAYNNSKLDYGAAATRTEITGWLQQDQSAEPAVDGRNPQTRRWLLMTNHQDVQATDRIEWDAHPSGQPLTFEVDGPPEPVYTPFGAHHLEVALKLIEG
jgi:hypothetical protein